MSDFDELDTRERQQAERLRRQLRGGDELDFVTRAKLSAARARALGAVAPRRNNWFLAAGGVAAAAVLAVLLVLPQRSPQNVPAYDALEVMTDELEPEFYEDMDLYRWLAEDGGSRA